MDTASYDLLSTAVLLLDHDGVIQHANTAAEELFSISRRLLSGRPVHELFSTDSGLNERLPDALDGKFGILRQDLKIQRGSEHIAVGLALVPLQGQAWAALMEIRVLEHHLLLDRHRQLSKELTAQRESLRNLAHEVKNPLGGIRGAAQLLQAELNDPGLSDYTQVIIAEADRLAGLVDRLIAPQGGVLQRTQFNIHQVCERVLRLAGIEFPSIAFARDYDASVPEVNADFSRILQALLNLVRNAAQALTETSTGVPPALLIRTRIGRQLLLGEHQTKLAVIVAVIDNGPGVPEGLRDKLFHPLVTGRASGTGLGLSLAQEFVQQHAGIVEFDSRPGHTEFRLILPLEPMA
jgi:two-component system nitrogen regulation sensor histidine kinase GlnL